MVRIRARLVLPDRVVDDGVLDVVRDRIVAVETAPHRAVDDTVDLRGATVLPGLVDVHAHGAAGGSFADPGDGPARAAARHHLEHGTTTILASLVTAEPAALRRQVATLAGLVAEGVVAGVHLEGPFLSPVRAGAHDVGLLRAPDPDLMRELLELGAGTVRQVTVAPELRGALPLVRMLGAAGVVAAVGHSDADFAAMSAGFDAGAGLVTHLFNAMRPWRHRDAGAVAACLAAAARGQARVELIADGTHVDAGTLTAVHALLGPQRIVFVSDAMSATGLGDGRYRLGATPVAVRRGVARVADGDRDGALAGGTARLLDEVRWAHTTVGLPLADAVRCASLTPARTVGLHDRGALAPGLRADLLLVDRLLRPLAVMRAGAWVCGDLGVTGREALHRHD